MNEWGSSKNPTPSYKTLLTITYNHSRSNEKTIINRSSIAKSEQSSDNRMKETLMVLFHSFINPNILNCSRIRSNRQNSRIKNSMNQDYGFDNSKPKRIDDTSRVGKNGNVDQTLIVGPSLFSRKHNPQEMNFKKVDQKINNSKRKNKFSLGFIPVDLWSIKEGGENRKLRVKTNFSRAVEKIGLIPRSIIRTSDRFRKQLFPGTETLLLQEFRISRYQILVSLKCLLALIFIPLTVHFLTKNLILTPLIEYLWNNNKNDIFLNSTQQEQALNELQDFENEIYFELLVAPQVSSNTEGKDNNKNIENGKGTDSTNFRGQEEVETLNLKNSGLISNVLPEKRVQSLIGRVETHNLSNSPIKDRIRFEGFSQEPLVEKETNYGINPKMESSEKRGLNFFSNERQEDLHLDQNKILNQKQEFQEKTVALAIKYNQQSIDSLIRLTSDFITVLTLIGVILVMKAEIIILKSFLIETVYSFNDTTKSFLIIFITDLLVGFHSSPGWELFFQSILNRFGLPFTETSILLTVAIVPVFLDTLFKYWIFRYLNKISPTTVATLNAMRE